MSFLGRFGRGESKSDQPGIEDGAEGRNWVAATLDQVPRPTVPLTEDWEISVAALVRTVPGIPAVAVKPLGLLDRLGAVHLGTREVGFDGSEVPWDKVVKIDTNDAAVVFLDQALDNEIKRWRQYVPPVPGRTWVLSRLGELLATLVLAVYVARQRGKSVAAVVEFDVADAEFDVVPEAGPGAEVPGADTDLDAAVAADRAPDEADAAPVPAVAAVSEQALRVPARIHYRSRLGRTRTVELSLSSMLLLLAVSSAPEALLDTARSKGIPIVDVPAEESDIGAVARRADALADRLRGFRRAAVAEEAVDG